MPKSHPILQFQMYVRGILYGIFICSWFFNTNHICIVNLNHIHIYVYIYTKNIIQNNIELVYRYGMSGI